MGLGRDARCLLRAAQRDAERGATPSLHGATSDRFPLCRRARMPWNNIISRADALPLIPDEIVADVIKQAATESAALSLFRQVSMGTKISSLPVLSALAQAYFVSGDTGLKQTTEM